MTQARSQAVTQFEQQEKSIGWDLFTRGLPKSDTWSAARKSGWEAALSAAAYAETIAYTLEHKPTTPDGFLPADEVEAILFPTRETVARRYQVSDGDDREIPGKDYSERPYLY